MKNNIKKSKKTRQIFYFVSMIFCFVLSSISFGAVSCFSEGFKMDRLAYSINDYNAKSILDDDFHSTIISINKDDGGTGKDYNNLFYNFYYNAINGGVRIKDNSQYFCLNRPITLITQPTFSVGKKMSEESGYYLDYGLYFTYYADEILPNREYLVSRFGCDSFIFITDTFADELIDYYESLDPFCDFGSNPYEILIKNEKFAKLSLINDEHETITCSINNIIKSKERRAPRTIELYGNFVLTSYSQKVSSSFEIDLKDNAYCIKSVFKQIKALGFNSNNSNISFYSFNNDDGSYQINDYLTNNFSSIYKNNINNIVAISIYCLIIITGCILLYLIVRKQTSSVLRAFSLLTCILAFALYSIIASFVYVYSLFSVAPIVFLAFLIFLWGKEAVSIYGQRIFKKSINFIKGSNCEFYEIQI